MEDKNPIWKQYGYQDESSFRKRYPELHQKRKKRKSPSRLMTKHEDIELQRRSALTQPREMHTSKS